MLDPDEEECEEEDAPNAREEDEHPLARLDDALRGRQDLITHAQAKDEEGNAEEDEYTARYEKTCLHADSPSIFNLTSISNVSSS